MNLYKVKAVDLKMFYGTIENQRVTDMVIIGANEDNSEYLVLTTEVSDKLIAQNSVPDGFIFTYRQEWGLTINEEIINRVKKDIRNTLVSKLVITLPNGMSFDANEVSQARMARAIIALPVGTTIPWVLADNSVSEVGKDILQEALLASGTAQTALWVKYQ